MKRLLVLSMLSLATAGCAQSKGALLRGASYPPSPVALTPVPSIYDTVNSGVGGEKVAQTAIKNPDDPHWSGRAEVSVAARPVPPGTPNSPSGPGGAVPAAGAAPAGPALAAVQPQPAPAPPVGAAPATAPPATAPVAADLPVPSALPQSGGQGPDSLAASPSNAGPAGPAAEIGPAAAPESVSLSAAPAANDAGTPPPDSTSDAAKLTAASPVEAAVSPSASAAPATSPAAGSPAPARGRDPLLGPEPDLLPAMPDLPSVTAKAKQPPPQVSQAPPEAAPASVIQAPPPDGPPPLEVTPGLPPAASPQPNSAEPASPGPSAAVDLPIDADKSTAVSRPATAGLAAAGLSLEAAAPPGQLSQPPRPVPGAASLSGDRVDRNVVLASSEEPKKPRKDHKSVYKEPGGPVARVGDEIITYHDLIAAFKENLKKYPQLRGDGFNSAEQMQINREKDMLVRQTLAGLIDRTLLAQEAKRHIKEKKSIDRLYEEADKIWRTEEVLPLQRQYNVDSESKLKEALAEEGRSLDTMRQSFRQYFLAETYLHEKLKDRIKVELPDLLRYYNEHLRDHQFDRPAQITWRELVVEVEKYKSREQARKKADALLENLRRGANFQQLARSESDGPTSSRNQGGLMKTTPGSYAVKSINDALDTLPINQVSGVIEGPDSFHVLLVENRRPAGPASFEEIQDQIRPALENQKYRDERVAFVAKLQKNSLISIYNLSMDDSKRNSD
ncbi:MAG TPA: peptidylprolyl isomerase [Isosphaeraceae bacterium]|nr:peptidylprolyl isomerase [Isosphaeraceae bacterium]